MTSRSGPSLTASERRANGQELLQGIWLPATLVTRLDAYTAREGLTRTAVVKFMLERLLANDDADWDELERAKLRSLERREESAEREE